MGLISIRSYSEFLKEIPYPRCGRYYYRGINATYHLVPSMAYNDLFPRISDPYIYEQNVMTAFTQTLIEEYAITNLNNWELWFMGRHFGLKSRLSDFTTDDTIAFQFAIENAGESSARIYCLDIESSSFELIQQDELREVNPFTFNRPCMIHPAPLYSDIAVKKLGVSRIQIQRGNFLYQPLESITTPINSQFYPEHWKIFEIHPEHFGSIKKEIEAETRNCMDMPLLKYSNDLDKKCAEININSLM